MKLDLPGTTVKAIFMFMKDKHRDSVFNNHHKANKLVSYMHYFLMIKQLCLLSY